MSPCIAKPGNVARIIDVKCCDDQARIGPSAWKQLKAGLAINPGASAFDLAVSTQTRVHRLRGLLETLCEHPGDNEDLLESIACYLEEISHLADATVGRLEPRP